MKTGQGFILVYSITTMTSFEAATKLRTQILRIKEEQQDIPIILGWYR
jgi:Ras-related protein Rap-1B